VRNPQQKPALKTIGLFPALLTEGARFESYLRSQHNSYPFNSALENTRDTASCAELASESRIAHPYPTFLFLSFVVPPVSRRYLNLAS
jgi:hypothetical protein